MQEPVSNLSLRLFGPFDVQVQGQPLPHLRTRKGQWLLALLTLRADRQVSRSWLAGTLWPQSRQEEAARNLRQSLHDLRRVLGEQAWRLQASTPQTLGLELEGAWADVVAFDAAIAAGSASSLEQAVCLYGGVLLEGCEEEWVLLEREAREQAYLQAREQLAEVALQAGDAVGAGVHLRAVIGVDALRESAQRSLMQALAANGDYAAAVAVYRELRLRLHHDLNAEPDPATTALFQQLRAQAKRRAQAAHTPLAAPTAQPLIRLPQPVSSLVGREQEITEVSASLSSVRLLTLTGAGGVGKTRLAIATAEAVADDYPDGVCFVDLAPLSDPALIPQTIASALEVREEPGRSLLETLRHSLRSKALLLVLDNCEHLLEGCIKLVAALLQSCRHLRVLATSRQSLGITGEMLWRVPSLPVPPLSTAPILEKEPVGVWLEYAGVKLFVARAQLISPAFRLSQANAGAVVQICQQLDGIPLALELAAGRLRALAVEQIASRLGDRFVLLRGGSRADLPRQQTLLATLDWSYELLSEAERVLLRRLSVFCGGWTLETAEVVCFDEQMQDWEELDLLASLVDKSLVIAEEREGKRRYRLLESIREYGREKLHEVGEEKRWRGRHLDLCLQLAEEAEPELTGAEQAEWLQRLQEEHDNLRAALQGCRQDQERTEAGLRLAGALWRFWEICGYFSEGREHLHAVLSQATVHHRTPARAKALNGAGNLASDQGDYAAARALYEQSLAIRRELGDKWGIAAALGNLGNVAREQGDYAAARALYEQGLAIRRELGDKWGIAAALGNLGLLEHREGDYAAARVLQEESLTLRRELGDKQGIAASLNGLGNVVSEQGDYAAARSLYEESLVIRRELGYKQGIAYSLHGLGNMAREQGDYAATRSLYEESLAIFREIGDKQHIAYSLTGLGNVALDMGDDAAARSLYEESLVIRRELGNKQGIADSLYSLGNVAQEKGDHEAARVLFEESLSLRRELGDKWGIAFSLEVFANLAVAEGQPECAARLWGSAEALREAFYAPLPPSGREEYDRNVTAVRTALGEEAFAAVWKQGRAMSMEQAVEYALEQDEE